MNINEIALAVRRKIKLLVVDVDGVLTDGSIGIANNGVEFKFFNSKDGGGFMLWKNAGGLSAFLTGRGSSLLLRRAQELRVDRVIINATDKLPKLKKLSAELNIPLDEIAYIGDDHPDLPCIVAVGIGVAVADATLPVLAAAKVITEKCGGKGAVREIIDGLLAARESLEP